MSRVQQREAAIAWHLDVHILRMVIAVADCPTASRAAARLAISPSALSHQMRKAEADLRVALFDRRGRRVRLTLAGEQLCASARGIVAGIEAAEGVLERTRRGERPTLRLGGGPYPVQRLLIGRLAPRDLAQIDLVSRTASLPLAQAVVDGEIDLALVGSGVRQRGAVATPAFEDELVAVVPTGHALAARPFLDPAIFGEATYLSYSRIVEEGLEDDLVFRPARRAPGRFVLAEDVGALLDLVEAGLGFTVLSRWSVPPGRAGLTAIPLVEGGARTTWSVVVRRSEADPEILALRDQLVAVLGSGPEAGPGT